MFYGVPGGLSGSAWGTQDSNGVWSGWANPAPQQVAAYDPGAGAAFGGAADAYMGDPNAYAAQMPAPVPVSQPAAGGMSPVGGASFGGGGATFGGAAPVPMAGDMSAGGSTSFNGGPGGMGGAAFGGASTSGAPDMGGFLRGLDWSPQNAANATRQMTQAMQQYGWTADQVGQNLGFTGQQINDHIAKYDAPSSGAQLSGAGGAGMSGYGNMPQNPYLPTIANDITRRSTDMMNAGIRQARGAAIMAGGFGGTGQGLLENAAIKGSVDNLAGQLGNLYGSAWNQDQSRDLQRYGMDQSFYGQQRGQDLQAAGLGASLLGQGVNLPWSPIQNAANIGSGFSGTGGSVTTPGQGGGAQGILGGMLAAAQLAKNFGYFL